MTMHSLAFRLFAAAAVWVFIVLVVAGVILASTYRNASEAGFDERLHVYLKTLVADLAGADDPRRATIGDLGEPRFEVPLSGWYWQVTPIDQTNGIVRTSRSLADASLPKVDDPAQSSIPGVLAAGYVEGPEKRVLRSVERVIGFGADGQFRFTVAAPATDIEEDIAQFQRALAISFVLVGAGLVATTLLQVRFGLSPLVRMRETLAAIRAGKAEKMPPNLPAEIEPLARELDALVDSNREIVERARTHVGNLAHALKTPLSVIANEAEAMPGPLAAKVLSQTKVMREQIDHHLQRARIAAAVSVVGTVTPARPVLEALVRTMEKIHRGKRFSFEIAPGSEPRFRGERQDLEEMTGNLLDNAGKWATSAVVVRVGRDDGDPRDRFTIIIEDDGPGVPEDARAELVRRGKRLDETVPGSGLGLSIVADLVALYGGTLDFDAAAGGGLRARLSLPAVS